MSGNVQAEGAAPAVEVQEPTALAVGVEPELELKNEVAETEKQLPAIVVIKDQVAYAAAGDFLVEIKTRQGKVKDFFAPMKKAAHDAHQAICDREKELLTPLNTAEAKAKKAMGDFQLAEAARREEEARQAREAERKRKEAEAERQAAADAERQKAEAGEEAWPSETGEVEGGSSSPAPELEPEIPEPAAPAISEKPMAGGTSASIGYDFEIIDQEALPREYLVPNEPAIRKVVQALGSKAVIPGVRIFPKATISASRRR